MVVSATPAESPAAPLLPRQPSPPQQLNELLSIIITTSPVQSNPSTAMLDRLLCSLNHVSDLRDSALNSALPCGTATASQTPVRLFIFCDGYRVGDRCKWKRGVITKDAEQRYQEYIKALEKIQSQNAHPFGAKNNQLKTAIELQVIVMKTHMGFGKLVEHAVKNVLKTPFIMVLQHDYVFVSSFPLRRLVQVMRLNAKKVKYIKLNSLSTNEYAKLVEGRYHIEIRPELFKDSEQPDDDLPINQTVQLLPLLFYYDKTHLASREFYLSTVFNERISEGKWKIKKGHFIEDTFGQYQLNDIKKQGMDAHANYQTYLYLPQRANHVQKRIEIFDQRIIAHLDGRAFITEQLRLKMYLSDRIGQANPPTPLGKHLSIETDGAQYGCKESLLCIPLDETSLSAQELTALFTLFDLVRAVSSDLFEKLIDCQKKPVGSCFVHQPPPLPLLCVPMKFPFIQEEDYGGFLEELATSLSKICSSTPAYTLTIQSVKVVFANSNQAIRLSLVTSINLDLPTLLPQTQQDGTTSLQKELFVAKVQTQTPVPDSTAATLEAVVHDSVVRRAEILGHCGTFPLTFCVRKLAILAKNKNRSDWQKHFDISLNGKDPVIVRYC